MSPSAGYLASRSTFPHQSTVDQFFNPDQFDAYRYLGYESGLQLIKALRLETTIGEPAAIIAQYCEIGHCLNKENRAWASAPEHMLAKRLLDLAGRLVADDEAPPHIERGGRKAHPV